MIGRLVVVATMLSGCIEPHLTDCPGYECPNGTACDLAHQSCVDQSQLDVCAGMPDLTPCVADTVSGLCFDMVCLEPGCGNRVVETGEECDDGNHVSGDGCSLDCASTEKCGNGVLDVAFGEQCDDGNFANHDGCTSQCQPERVAYSVTPIRITDPEPYLFAYDRARNRLVFAGPSATWEWDGATWQIAELQRTVIDSWKVITYDDKRERVIGFGATGGKVLAATWDGTTWTAFAPSGTTPGSPLAATYYPPDDAIAVVTATQLVFFDVPTNTWKGAVSLPGQAQAPTVAFDKHRGALTVLEPTAGGVTWAYGPADWTTYASVPPGTGGWAMVYDPARDVLLAIGGSDNVSNFHEDVSVLDSAQKWTPLQTVVAKAGRQTVWVDRDTGDPMTYGGFDATGALDTMFRLKGGNEALPVPLVEPGASGALVHDSLRRQLVLATPAGDMWTHDATGWTPIATAGVKPPPSTGPLVFDPIRGVGLAVDATNVTWEWDPTMWKSFTFPTSVALTPMVTTYDYTRRAFVSVGAFQTSSLDSTGTSWSMYGPGIGATSAAYDLGNKNVVVLGTAGDGLADLGAAGWQLSLSPGPGYAVASWFARKSILMVPRAAIAGTVRQIWERSGSTFRSLGPLPIENYGLDGVTEGQGGEIVFALHDGGGALLLHMQLRSALADETCTAVEDADGDGLSACDDPDCWEGCWPACPYAASCP